MKKISQKAEYYNHKSIWSFEEMCEAENFRQTLKFETDDDLDFEVMNFF